MLTIVRNTPHALETRKKFAYRLFNCCCLKSSRSFSSIFDNLVFDNRNLRALSVEPSPLSPHHSELSAASCGILSAPSSRQVSGAIFSRVRIQPVTNPTVVAVSKHALASLNIRLSADDIARICERDGDGEFVECFAGNKAIPGSEPAAHCYAGHQFGYFSGQLGDGAAMYLGELVIQKEDETSHTVMKDSDTARKDTESNTSVTRVELQLKGSGTTPYSRTADGRKVLRSSIREFLCSEAMYFLGVPTTRSATCITSDSTVSRDPLYNNNVIQEKCTIISRFAPNFFRFGSFEIFKERPISNRKPSPLNRGGPSEGDEALRKQLFNHVLSYYPHLLAKYDAVSLLTDAVTGRALYNEVVRRTASLVAKWQSVGFTHGVLNTDNMSLMGLTIDYGPYGFMEFYDPDFCPNGSDRTARYSFRRQNHVCKWNLLKFAEALGPLLLPLTTEETGQNANSRNSNNSNSTSRSKAEVDATVTLYDAVFNAEYNTEMRKKLGLVIQSRSCDREAKGDQSLITDFMHNLERTRCDYTDSFVAITECVEEILETVEMQKQMHDNSDTMVTEHTLQKIINSCTAKLVSRCATPQEILDSSLRQTRVHGLGMKQEVIAQCVSVMQQAELLDARGEEEVLDYLFSFPPASLDNTSSSHVRARSTKETIESQGVHTELASDDLNVDEARLVAHADICKMFGVQSIGDAVNSIASEQRALGVLIKASKSIRKYRYDSHNDSINNTSSGNTTELNDANSELWHNWVTQYVEYITAFSNCASTATGTNNSKREQLQMRLEIMRATNPTFILRSWVLQDVIRAAEQGDYLPVNVVLKMVENPFNPSFSVYRTTDAINSSKDENKSNESQLRMKYSSIPVSWACGTVNTCSS